MHDQTELLALDHKPIREPRAGTPGEGIYLGLWRDLMSTRPTLLEQIFTDLPFTTDQRAASVAATFMVWMGCNGGRDFTYNAERLAATEAHPTRSIAFLAAWCVYDQRRRGVNSGLRASEFMLAERYPLGTERFTYGRVMWDLVPEIAMRDRDVLESMVFWWSSAEATSLRSIAKPLIDAAERRHWSGLFPRDAALEAEGLR